MFVTIDDPTASTAETVDVMEDQTWRWTTSAGTSVYPLVAEPHQIGVLQREGGARVDKLALTISAMPPP